MSDGSDGSPMHPAVVSLLKCRQWEQRTPEWYEIRKRLLTASDVASALGVPPYASYRGDIRGDTLRKKVENKFQGNMFTAHGQKYEDEAREMFENVTGLHVLEFGLLVHPDHEWLAASPDGVTTTGWCVEIKCPLRRKIIPGHPPHHYVPQMQVQMAVTGMRGTYFIQYLPAHLNNGVPFMDVCTVEYDDHWFTVNVPKLRDFFNDYMRLRETYVPTPDKIVVSMIKDDMYEDLDLDR